MLKGAAHKEAGGGVFILIGFLSQIQTSKECHPPTSYINPSEYLNGPTTQQTSTEQKRKNFLSFNPPHAVFGECGLGGFRGKVMSDSNADTAAEPLKEHGGNHFVNI